MNVTESQVMCRIKLLSTSKAAMDEVGEAELQDGMISVSQSVNKTGVTNVPRLSYRNFKHSNFQRLILSNTTETNWVTMLTFRNR
jgi:hypothetical protein